MGVPHWGVPFSIPPGLHTIPTIDLLGGVSQLSLSWSQPRSPGPQASQNCSKVKPHWPGPQSPPLTLASNLRNSGSETLGELFLLFTNEALVLAVVRLGMAPIDPYV